MFVDFSFFNAGPAVEPTIDSPQVGGNFLAAFVVVTVFNAAVIVALTIPAAAIAAALSVDPTFESDGKFHWNFSYPENNPTLALELTAEVGLQGVVWEMFVTSQTHSPPLNNFRWFDGESELDGESGTWQFYDDRQPSQTIPTTLIEWEFVSESDRTLTFNNVHQGMPGFGDVLRYQVAGEDVSMLFVQASTSDSVNISWNMTTEEGFIIAPEYRNGEKSCWDSNQNDVDCPD
jgi:hypothetical protein